MGVEMNKEQIGKIALAIYKETDWRQEISIEETVVSFATRFLARVDAERAKEGPVAVINFNRMKYVEWFIEPEDTLDAGVLLYTSPQPIPEGYKLVPDAVISSFPEINPNNYNHEDVCALNDWGTQLVLAAAPEEKP